MGEKRGEGIAEQGGERGEGDKKGSGEQRGEMQEPIACMAE